jgi:hypothetical protein
LDIEACHLTAAPQGMHWPLRSAAIGPSLATPVGWVSALSKPSSPDRASKSKKKGRPETATIQMMRTSGTCRRLSRFSAGRPKPADPSSRLALRPHANKRRGSGEHRRCIRLAESRAGQYNNGCSCASCEHDLRYPLHSGLSPRRTECASASRIEVCGREGFQMSARTRTWKGVEGRRLKASKGGKPRVGGALTAKGGEPTQQGSVSGTLSHSGTPRASCPTSQISRSCFPGLRRQQPLLAGKAGRRRTNDRVHSK